MADFVKFNFENNFFNKPILFSPYSIIQVGDIDTYSGFKFQPHIQAADEITYIVSGNANILCGDESCFCKAGDIIFNPKGSMHAIDSADSHSLRYYYLAFDIANKSSDCEQRLFEFFKNQKASCATADRSISHTFHDIFLNLHGNDEFSSAIVSDSIRKLLIYTLRSLNGEANSIYVPDVRFGKKRTVAQICSFIDANSEDIDVLKKLSDEFGYSYSYISSFFSKSTGLNLKEYFLKSRHHRACNLLLSGLSVTVVSERMGYSSIHAFSKAFTKYEGISPKKYIQNKSINS